MKQTKNSLIQLHNVYMASSTIYKSEDIRNVSLNIYTDECISIICQNENLLSSIALVITGKIKHYSGEIVFYDSSIPPLQAAYTRKLRNLLGGKIKYISNHSETCLIPSLKVEESFSRIQKEQENVNFTKTLKWAMLEENILLRAKNDPLVKDFFQQEVNSLNAFVKLHEIEKLIPHYKQLIRQYRAAPLYSAWSTMYKLKVEKRRLIKESIKIYKENDKNYEIGQDQVENLAKEANEIYKIIKINDREKNSKKNKHNAKLLKIAKKELKIAKVERINCRTSIEKEINRGRAKAKEIVSQKKPKKIAPPKFVYRNIKEWEGVESLSSKVKRVKGNIKQYISQDKDRRQYKKVWRRYQPYLYFSKELKNYILQEVSNYLDYFSISNSEKRWKEKATKELEAVGLNEAYLKFKPEELNEIEKLKVGISISLFTKPSVIFFRDPSDIDTTLRGEILELIKDVREERGFSLVFLTDSILQGLALSSYSYILSDQVVEHGRSDSIAASPTHPHTRNMLEKTLTPDTIYDNVLETRRIEYLLLNQREEIKIGNEHYVFGTKDEVKIWEKDREHFESKRHNKYITKNNPQKFNIKI